MVGDVVSSLLQWLRFIQFKALKQGLLWEKDVKSNHKALNRVSTWISDQLGIQGAVDILIQAYTLPDQ